MSGAYFKSFQDLKPVVLTKNKPAKINDASKSSFHILNKKDTDEIKPIIYYTHAQKETIKIGRNALGLNQVELARKISTSLPKDFITKIENGNIEYNAMTYKTILRNLNIKG
jgi:ribosome-binding protein aMBF1 (putative translation factor)